MSATDNPWLRAAPDGGVLLSVYVQPKASRNKIAGLYGDAVKISIAAPPVDGMANETLIRFLAKLCNLPRSAVTLEAGQQSRSKRFRLHGITPAAVRELLEPLLFSP